MFVITNWRRTLKYAVLSVAVMIGAIYFKKVSPYYDNPNKIDVPKKKIVLKSEELIKYDGIQEEKLYLAIVGNVFDVTIGTKHYATGSPYHYFIGKDGTRALVTGNFKDKSSDKDHILDLSCDDLLTILRWRQTYKQKYTYVGILVGRYYDENGVETLYMRELKQRITQCKLEKEEVKNQEKIYPPCNMSWSEEDGAKVWCTKSSGGVVRGWVGVPRQLYTPGEEKPQCVCVNLDKINTNQLKEYNGCPKTSTQCSVVDS